MTHNHDMQELEAERLLRGRSSESDDVAAQFLDALDRLVPEQSTAGLEAAHMAAMLDAAHDTAPVAPARIRPVRTGFVPPRWHKVAGLSLAATLAFGGTAYAGVLPEMVQNAVSAAVRPLGIELPSSDHAAASRVEPGSGTSTDGGPAVTSGAVKPRPAPPAFGTTGTPSVNTTPSREATGKDAAAAHRANPGRPALGSPPKKQGTPKRPKRPMPNNARPRTGTGGTTSVEGEQGSSRD